MNAVDRFALWEPVGWRKKAFVWGSTGFYALLGVIMLVGLVTNIGWLLWPGLVGGAAYVVALALVSYRGTVLRVRSIKEKVDSAGAILTGWRELAGPEASKTEALEDLVCSLWLYTGRYEWTQLTTEQKELWADALDKHQLAEYPDEFTPQERWWR